MDMKSIADKLPLDIFATNTSLRIFLRIAMLFPLIAIEHTHPAAVLVRDTGEICIGFDLRKMAKFNTNQQVFIIAHEISHILLAHLGRTGKFNRKIWNLATDAKINDLLCQDYKFYMSPPTDEKGHVLGVFLNDFKESGLINKAIPNSLLRAEDIYNFLMKDSAGEPIGASCIVSTSTFDTHPMDITEKDLDSSVSARITKIVSEYEEEVRAGSITGNLIKYLTSSLTKYIDLEAILNRALDVSRIDFKREHRRLRLPGFYIPRFASVDPAIYIGIDVSGSCYEFQDRFISYVYGLPRFHELVFIDTEIKGVLLAGSQRPEALQGFGGTDLNPLFARWKSIENEMEVDVNFVLLTDGDLASDLIDGPSHSPVIILTTGKDIIDPNGTDNYINIHI